MSGRSTGIPSLGPPRKARAAGLVGVAEVEQLVQQLPERGRGPGRDLAFRGRVPVGDRGGRGVARPEQRVPEGPQAVRGELVPARDPAPQELAGGQRLVEDRLHRAHGPRLGRGLVTQRAQRATPGTAASVTRRASRAPPPRPDVVRQRLAPRATSRAISSASASRAAAFREDDQWQQVRRRRAFLHVSAGYR